MKKCSLFVKLFPRGIPEPRDLYKDLYFLVLSHLTVPICFKIGLYVKIKKEKNREREKRKRKKEKEKNVVIALFVINFTNIVLLNLTDN